MGLNEVLVNSKRIIHRWSWSTFSPAKHSWLWPLQILPLFYIKPELPIGKYCKKLSKCHSHASVFITGKSWKMSGWIPLKCYAGKSNLFRYIEFLQVAHNQACNNLYFILTWCSLNVMQPQQRCGDDNIPNFVMRENFPKAFLWLPI